MVTEERLREIEALCQAATPGPWSWSSLREAFGGHIPATVRWIREEPEGRTTSFIATADSYRVDNDANVEFIANARTDVPLLLTEVRDLRAQNAVLRKQQAGERLTDDELAAYTLCPEHGQELVKLRALATELAATLEETTHAASCLIVDCEECGRIGGAWIGAARNILAKAKETGLLEAQG